MKNKKINFIAFMAILLISTACSNKKTVQFEVDISREATVTKEKKSTVIITFEENNASMVKYKNFSAISYAKKYAALNNNSCGIFNNNPTANLSDCAHFIAHCLKDGGITIKAKPANLAICKDGLSFRVLELTSALDSLSKIHSNVQKINISDAIIGDYGFFKIPAYKPTHAFMICQPAANTDNITIYAHTTNRSCTTPEPKWYNFFDRAYRITDAN